MDLSIFTLNCWGIPLISKHCKDRISAIIEAVLNIPNVNIVCFQEVWSKAHFELMRDKFHDKLPHSHYFYCGIFGSGLCLFSKFPIIDVFFYQWPLNGYVHKIQHADWFGGKGIGLCQLLVDEFKINVYIAHLHAEYGATDTYYSHRIHQAFETSKFIKLTSNGCDGVILAGDLNIEHHGLAYKIMMETLQLKDSCVSLGMHIKPTSTDVSLKTNFCEPFATTNTNENSFSDKSGIPKRIDYVFYGTVCPLSKNKIQINVTNYQQPLPSRVPGANFSYSDHEAVFVTLKVIADVTDSRNETTAVNTATLSSILNESKFVLNKGIDDVERNQKMYLICSILLIVIIVYLNIASVFFANNYVWVLLHFTQFFLIASFFYTVIMATFWNYYEKNALTSTKIAIEKSLQSLLKS